MKSKAMLLCLASSQSAKTNRHINSLYASQWEASFRAEVWEKIFKHRFTFFSPTFFIFFLFFFPLNADGLFFVLLKIAKFELNVTLEHKIMSSLEQNR